MTTEQVKGITDQSELAEIAKNDKLDMNVRNEAVKMITDQTLLHEFAKGRYFRTIQDYAADRITDQALLADLVRNAPSFVVQRTAAREITGREDLLEILGYHQDDYIINEVLVKLADLETLREFVNNTENKKAAEIAAGAIARLEVAERVSSKNKTGNLKWGDTDELVAALAEKYPRTPPVALTLDRIHEMVVGLDEFNDSPLPPSKIYLSSIQYDWIKFDHGVSKLTTARPPYDFS
jgi:FeS assembly protein IscX